MKRIDGRAIAAGIAEELGKRAAVLRDAGHPPALAVVVPTRDDATAWYVRMISRTAAKVGVECRVHEVYDADSAAIGARLAELSADPAVHGVICQTPLPDGVLLAEVAEHIDPAKDVDGANPVSLGRLVAGLPSYPPATAAAVMEILRAERVPLVGTRAAVVGRSIIVGKPVALLLLAEHATVTICHSRTVDLIEATRAADVLVAAVGQPGLITGGHVRPGAVVVDVGTNPTPDGGLVGDVDADSVAEVAAALTPVPGGVGPVTTMLLLRHTVGAAEELTGLSPSA